MTLLGALFVLCCQDPSQPAPAAPAPLDVVELRNGDQLHGRVLVAIDGFVEIELEEGARVGFPSAQVRAIRRGAAVAPAVQTLVPPRREWFLVHDATGTAVGWLATAVAHRPDGGFSVSEEYEFQQGKRRYQVTSLAVADAGGAARSAFFRERITEPAFEGLSAPGGDASGQQDRIVDERIVEADCRDDRLVVVHVDRRGRAERELAWGATHGFPLLARTLARARRQQLLHATLFDPAAEEMVVRSYDGRRLRSVALEGAVVQVTEVAEAGAHVANHEWVDANARTLRRELAGPALVAVAVDADRAQRPLGVAAAPAVVAEAGGAFGLWIPNPAWQAVADLPAGRLVLAEDAHGASITLSRLDQLEPDATRDVAVTAVANAYRLLHPGLDIREQHSERLRDREALRLVAASKGRKGEQRHELDIVAVDGGFLLLACQAPAAAWDELAADFAFVRRSVELRTQALQPRLQGPLAEGPAPRAAKVAAAPAVLPLALPPAAPMGETGGQRANVRIPGDG